MSKNVKSIISKLIYMLLYALDIGVWRWGMGMIVLMTLYDIHMYHQTINNTSFQTRVIAGVVCGFILGIIMWLVNGKYKTQYAEK